MRSDPAEWFVCEEELSGAYLPGVQDIIDAGEDLDDPAGDDPAIYADLVVELGRP